MVREVRGLSTIALAAMLVAGSLVAVVTGVGEDADDWWSEGNAASAPFLESTGAGPGRAAAFKPSYFTESPRWAGDGIGYSASTRNMLIGFAQSSVLLRVGNPEVSTSPGAVLPNDAPVSITFDGSNQVEPKGLDEMGFPTYFYIGNDPATWGTEARSFRRIAYRSLYEDTDLIYSIQESGLKYEFILGRGADPSLIGWTYSGVQSVGLDSDGVLLLETGLGPLRDAPPTATQGDLPVTCRYVVRGPSSVDLDCPAWDTSIPGVIDPLVWSTLLGGDGKDWPRSIAIDGQGFVYIGGATTSNDFPGTLRSYLGNGDAFVAKFDPTGSSLIYAAFIGGWVNDEGTGIAIDSTGSAYLTGMTYSSDFPLTPGAFDTSLIDGQNAFAVKLSPAGDSIVYGTYIGGESGYNEWGFGIAVNAVGEATVVGLTEDSDFPTTPVSYQQAFGGGWDAFVTTLNANGTALVASTLLGGQNMDLGLNVKIDAAGSVYVVGYTSSPDFPTTPGALDQTVSAIDLFVAKLDSTLETLQWSTVLGGSGYEGDSWFFMPPSDMALGPAGSVYVAGFTDSTDFPVTEYAFQRSNRGGYDAYVAKLDSTGSTLLWSTYLGGTDGDAARSIAVDAGGDAYVTGSTYSTDFPFTPDAFNKTIVGQTDVFVARLNGSEGWVGYATAMGSIGWDSGESIAVDGSGGVFVTGYAHTGDFPTTPGAYSRTHGGSDMDAFIAKLGMPSTPQYLQRFESFPPGRQVWADGVNYTTPDYSWCRSGTSFTLNTSSPQLASGARHTFQSWSDGGLQSHVVTCTRAEMYTATFVTEWQVSLGTWPLGLQLVVDGSPVTAPVTPWWKDGSAHTVDVPSPQLSGSAGTRYIWQWWSDAGPRNRTITASGSVIITAQFTSEYHVALVTSHGAPECDRPDCWYAPASTARISIEESISIGVGTRHAFHGWIGDVAGASANKTFNVDAPKTVTATWTTEFRLVVESQFGNATGGGWYPENATATISVSPTEVDSNGTRYRFAAWSGATTDSAAYTTLLLDGPKTATAVWQEVIPSASGGGTDFLVFLLIAIAVIVALLAVAIVWRSRRKRGPA